MVRLQDEGFDRLPDRCHYIVPSAPLATGNGAESPNQWGGIGPSLFYPVDGTSPKDTDKNGRRERLGRSFFDFLLPTGQLTNGELHSETRYDDF